ncbi:hypothetical protein HF888_03150 [Bermanella marisrubri]|uniref:Chemotaxis sensory transducer n=1 Tax=Bermanella marisrubri TaxID=207949 RepID=Q1N0I8_9GAMM|nr:CZB domain-containing protein [Bermanella marisrubri]EAT11676.1 chemotaxis sensory transducer [Oceanobacter sp. RED65] [Bermanella marisrubri]QIZ83288.1 hypothetical protein HF888_03150 [Bermanella marisrubri]
MLAFKSKILESIDENVTDESYIDNIRDHTAGRMGKWYYEGLGKSTFSHLNSYKKMEHSLIAIHESAYQALVANTQNRNSDKFEHLSSMENHSINIIQTMLRFNDELQNMAEVSASDSNEDVLF